MSIHFQTITRGVTPPTSPKLGDLWDKPLEDKYQEYMWLSKWVPTIGGGNATDETLSDDLKIKIIVQEAPPFQEIKNGGLWVKESILQASLYLGGFIPWIGA
jgi:hypothetical protein